MDGRTVQEQDAARRRALHRYEILDTEQEPEFNELTRHAARVFAAPVALISLVDDSRLWFKSQFGLDATEAPRELAFCDEAITSAEVLVVPDATLDPRFRDSAAVTGALHARFYAGAPLITPDGARIGTICVLDTKPRPALTGDEQDSLAALARMTVHHLEHRNDRRALLQATRRSERIAALQSLVSAADTCEESLDGLLAALCRHHDAGAGQIHRLDPVSHNLLGVSHFETNADRPDHLSLAPHPVMTQDNSLVAATILAAAPRTVDFTAMPAGSLARYPFCEAALQAGFVCMVIQPIIFSGNHFGLTLVFERRRDDLAEISADVRSLTDVITPALRRKLVESRALLLSKALDCAVDGVVITGADVALPGPTIVYANTGCTAMSGYAAAEIVGRTPRLFQGPDTDRAMLQTLRQRLLEWKPTRVELLNHRKDGSPFWVELDITPVTDESGWVTHWISIQRDVTRRREEAASDLARNALNRSLFDQNPTPMWVVEQGTHRFLDVNEAAIRHYGWSRDAFLAMTLLDVRNAAEREIYLKSMERPFNPVINERVWTHLRADGSEIKIRSVSHAVIYEGRDARMSVIWDVTGVEAARHEQIVNAQRLSKLAATLQARTEEMADVQRLARLGSWRHLAATSQAVWSDEMFSILGRSAADFTPTAEHVIACLHPDDRSLGVSTFRRVLDSGVPEMAELRIMRPDGAILHTSWSARQLADESGAVIGLVGYCQDITERRNAEDALRRSEKLKSLGQLTGGIAHDFNNLLTVVTLNLEEALETLDDDSRLRSMLQPALHASTRGAELTAQLLSYSRRAVLQPRRVTLASFFVVLRPLLTRAIGKLYELVIDLGDDEVDLLVDPGQLENALVNLAINARDAMPLGGIIRIQARQVTLETNRFGSTDDVPAGHYVEISVIDHGTGIAPETLARVFEPFFTTKDVGRGSGLGLSMVFGFAKQSGGHVTLQSAVGQGTTVRLYLPCDAACVPRALPAAATQGWDATGLRVLVVEDQAPVLETVIRVLRSMGFAITAARSAGEAMTALASGLTFDLLFSDIMLQGPVNGLALSASASAMAPDMRILLTTGFTEHNVETLHGQGLAAELLMKPYKRIDLVAKLKLLFPEPARTTDTRA